MRLYIVSPSGSGFRVYELPLFSRFEFLGFQAFCIEGLEDFGFSSGSFRKLGVSYFGVLTIRILLFRVLY